MSQSITITLPERVYQTVHDLAQKTQQNVVQVLTDTIVAHFDTPHFPVDPNRDLMAREETAYQAMHPELLAHYAYQFVAIFQGKLVDHDQDVVALSQRINENFPDETVLITDVLPEVAPEIMVRSPRLIH